jgi:hypothetical protein
MGYKLNAPNKVTVILGMSRTAVRASRTSVVKPLRANACTFRQQSCHATLHSVYEGRAVKSIVRQEKPPPPKPQCQETVSAERFLPPNVVSRLPLWSSGQSSWLQIHRSGFDYRHYQIFLISRGSGTGSTQPLSTIEELLGRKSSGSGIENRDYSRR